MLSQKLLAVTNLGAEWVLWVLLALSVISVGIMIERAIFFATRRLANADALVATLLKGDLAGARGAVEGRQGMEAEVVRAALENAGKGPDAVGEVIQAQLNRSRLDYERRLSFLGTVGNNAPFIGLLGTVLGIIRASGDLATHPGAGGVDAVIGGISEALIATAVGLFVAIPAVVMFNLFQRWLRRASQRAQELGHALVAHLKAAR